MRHIQNGIESERESTVEAKAGEIVILDVFRRRHIPGNKCEEKVVSRSWKGRGASPGRVEGPIKILSSLEDFQSIRKENILVSRTAGPELTSILPIVSGLVTELGGILSIASSWARQLGVPAVVGVGNLLDLVQDGDWIRINGSEGTVEVIGNEI